MTTKRVFLSLPGEDAHLRDTLVEQARASGVSVEFVDYAVREAWDNVWRANCRMRVSACDGLIGIVTRRTPHTTTQLWEITCATVEAVSVLLIAPPAEPPARLPAALGDRPVVPWSWSHIAAFLDAL